MAEKIERNKNKNIKLNVHPWHRFAARYIDLNLFGLFIGLVFPKLTANTNSLEVTAIILALWVIVETLFMISWGCTPGKWMLNIKVRTKTDEKLNLIEALIRSLQVWFFGLAMGLPFISLGTLYYQYFNLGAKGATTWDKTDSFKVSHKKIGFFRGTLSILIIGLFIFLTITYATTQVNYETTVQSLNKDLPKMLNSDISVNKISIIDNSLVYIYKYVNNEVGEINKINLLYQKIILTKYSCNNKDTKKLLFHFKKLIYSYVDKNNNLINSVEINKNDCVKSEIELYNDQLPIMIDEITQLNQIHVYDSFIINDYKLVSIDKSEIDVGKLKNILRDQLMKNSCNNKSLFEIIPNQKGIVFNYSDKNNEEILSIRVLLNDCNLQ